MRKCSNKNYYNLHSEPEQGNSRFIQRSNKRIIIIIIINSSPNIVRVIKSRRVRWAGHVARMGEERGVYRVLVGKPEGDLGVDGWIILGRISRRWVNGLDWAGPG